MNSMQQRQQTQSRQRLFTASEVAQFEYCPLVWWHEQFEPLAQSANEELFARMVELEYEHGAQATALPEYQMIEQLLLRRGAFEEGHQQHLDHAGPDLPVPRIAYRPRVSLQPLSAQARAAARTTGTFQAGRQCQIAGHGQCDGRTQQPAKSHG